MATRCTKYWSRDMELSMVVLVWMSLYCLIDIVQEAALDVLVKRCICQICTCPPCLTLHIRAKSSLVITSMPIIDPISACCLQGIGYVLG